MGSIAFAFSVHHFISSVGSDAGFASIIGLAVLILLYFAHARETASLREQVYEWAQRVQQLEALIAQLSRQQGSVGTPAALAEHRAAAAAPSSTVAPTRASAFVGAAVAAGAPAGAPAGVAAPALTAATKLIPTHGGALDQPPAPVPGELPVDATAVVAPAPVTVAGGANGSSHDNGPASPTGAQGTRTAAPPPPRIQIRQGATAAGRRPPVPPRGQPPRGGRSRGRRGLAALLIVLAALLIVLVAGLLILTSGGGGSTKQKTATAGTAQGTTASATRHRATTAPVTPSSVTVAVLNGTATAGLAGRVSQKLAAGSYKPGTVATAADQTRTSTEVGYMPGHKREALAVARALNLGPASVQAVDQSTQAVACPSPSACTADVVVTVGTDLANTQ